MMKKFMQEFREFALKGNVMSLAVGVIIGAAFQDIVSSLTDNILSPVIGLVVGQNFDFLELNVLGITLRYGAFITSVFNFIILALVVFFLVRGMNRLLSAAERKHPDEAEAAPPEAEEPKNICPFCKPELPLGATRCCACTSFLNGEG